MRRVWLMARVGVALAVVGLIALTAAEIVLRANPGLMPPTAQLRLHWWDTDDAIAWVADPHLGFLHAPDQEGVVRHRDFAFTYSIDERGFRNAGPWSSAADIVAIGNSQTFGFGVDDPDGWVAVLDRALPQQRVVNLAINGSAPQQQLGVLDALQGELDPQVVLLGLFPGHALGAASEFQAWLEAGRPEPFPLFRKRPHGTPLWKRLAQGGIRHSRVLLAARTLGERLRSPYAGSTLEFPDGGRINFTPDIYAWHAEQAQPGVQAFDLVLDIIERAHALVNRQGGGFLVVLFPTKEEVYLPARGRPTPDMTGPFAAALGARGIPFVDLLPGLRERAAAGERLFLEIDIHPNERGYALIAAQVLEHLQAEPWRVAKAGGPRELAVRPELR